MYLLDKMSSSRNQEIPREFRRDKKFRCQDSNTVAVRYEDEMFSGLRSKVRCRNVTEFMAINILQFKALIDVKCMVLTTAKYYEP